MSNGLIALVVLVALAAGWAIAVFNRLVRSRNRMNSAYARIDAQIERFKQGNSGSDIKLTLLSTDNEQVAAKLQAAFQARKPPDMMLFYSGGYTTP